MDPATYDRLWNERRKRWSSAKLTKWAFLAAGAVMLIGPSSAQSTINKSELLKTTREDCPTQFVKNKQVIDLLLIGGGTLPEFCECFAVRIASQLDDSDYGDAKAVAEKWGDSQNFCLAVSLTNKKQ
jgi:hypothetical protein